MKAKSWIQKSVISSCSFWAKIQSFKWESRYQYNYAAEYNHFEEVASAGSNGKYETLNGE
jgi:hypothetical protein